MSQKHEKERKLWMKQDVFLDLPKNKRKKKNTKQDKNPLAVCE